MKKVAISFNDEEVKKLDTARGSESLYGYIKKVVLDSLEKGGEGEEMISKGKRFNKEEIEELVGGVKKERMKKTNYCLNCHGIEVFEEKDGGDFRCESCGTVQGRCRGGYSGSDEKK